jgi:hypothetical protein
MPINYYSLPNKSSLRRRKQSAQFQQSFCLVRSLQKHKDCFLRRNDNLLGRYRINKNWINYFTDSCTHR